MRERVRDAGAFRRIAVVRAKRVEGADHAGAESPWWLWPNLVALDAPIVAVAWQRFLAAVAGLQVPLEATAALAFSVWSIYLIDRQLDARNRRNLRTDRHRFARTHPHAVTGLACLALYGAAVAACTLPAAYLQAGGAVAFASMAYLAVIHLVSSRRRPRGLKEISVAIVFSVGIAIPLLAENRDLGRIWAPGAVAFGGLCLLNCLLISRWEDQASDVAPSSYLVLGSVATAGAALAAAPVVGVAVLLSLLLLGLLELGRGWLSTRSLRVLADATLLTPLFALALP